MSMDLQRENHSPDIFNKYVDEKHVKAGQK